MVEGLTTEPAGEMLAVPGVAPSEAHTAMVHLYRGEMHRMTVWRQRLDVTSNWAILLTMGLTTFALGSPQVPHYVLLLGLALIAISILIEGRRYRHLHHSKWRLYLMEQGYFAELLAPEGGENPWRELLAEDLRRPRYLISWFAAVAVRMRRNYLYLLYFVTAVWLTKVFIHPGSPASVGEFHQRLAVGGLVPSWLVAVTATLFVVAATLLSLRCPAAEHFEDWSEGLTSNPCSHSGAQPSA